MKRVSIAFASILLAIIMVLPAQAADWSLSQTKATVNIGDVLDIDKGTI